MSQGLFALLQRRMADERVGPDEPVAVAELHRRLLPYHTCRDSLGFATKAEYDVALLRLLADEHRIAVSEPALREAVRSEMRQPEPGLAFLHRFAASEVRLKAEAQMPPQAADGPAAAPGARSPGASDAGGPGRAGELEVAVAGTCRRCAADLPGVEGVRFCPACGADQVLPTCTECGAEVEVGWRYCAFCGKLQAGEAT